MDGIMIGARWDLSSQDARFRVARERALLDFVEVNYPVCASADPAAIGLPILAHTSNNPIASSGGIPEPVARAMKHGADCADSAWVGGLPLSDEVLAMAARFVKGLPRLRALTFEHAHDAPEDGFYTSLARLREAVS